MLARVNDKRDGISAMVHRTDASRACRSTAPASSSCRRFRDLVEAVTSQSRSAGDRLDASQTFEAVAFRLREERVEQLLAEPFAAARGDDGDGQLGRALVDEAVAPARVP